MLHPSKTSVVLCLFLKVVSFAWGQEIVVTSVQASKWDTRDSSNSGCGFEEGEGCVPGFTVDGKLNDQGGSRWSCHDEDVLPEGPCYIEYDLGSTFMLDNITLYFYDSDNSERHTNNFSVSVSGTGVTHEHSFDGNSTIPTPLGEGNNFIFEGASVGRYVRMTGINSDEKWLSVCETKVFGSPTTPAPASVLSLTSGPTSSASQASTPPLVETPAPSAMTASSLTFDPVSSPVTDAPAEAETPTGETDSSEAAGATATGYSDGSTTAIIAGSIVGALAVLFVVTAGVSYLARRSRRRQAL